ncbi:hypothetical protein BTR23_02945 [Alkalihalophilus pseudofirmus]|uniref:Na-translocating system protein MpsC family protein n=1 Tax=Alkalihalobacterium alkalinitrilicum TaxID=427920 RepID=UPI00094CCA5F|nr:Na-translocating system protein MpsC family protein [Alkalihalobacterium alkalinitrilicum]OLO42195.1 hypothetical protein BTR23_02945 [Alkalihalophilus pseudofirmus]
MEIQEQLKHISSYTSKLLRKNFGRGPESCQATLNGKHLVLYIRGFISPMEEVLVQKGQQNYVHSARDVIIGDIIIELKGVVQVTLQTDVHEAYHDWNFPNNSGMVILELENEVLESDEDLGFKIHTFEQEVSRISSLVQKVPEQINTVVHTKNILLVERVGILVPIEKALVHKGFTSELILTKDELEKKYFHRDGKFEEIFHRRVQDIFIDWNLIEDKSLMAFILK